MFPIEPTEFQCLSFSVQQDIKCKNKDIQDRLS